MKSKSGPGGLILRVGISIGALALVGYFLRDKLHESLQILVTAHWPTFVLANAIYLVAMLVMSFRLLLIFRVQGIRLSYFETVYLNFLGFFFNLFFPSAVGGDVAKAYYAYKHSGKKLESTTSVILDRMMGFVSLIVMAVLAILIFSKQINDRRIDLVIYLALGGMVLCMLFFASKRFARVFKFLKHLIPSAKWQDKIAEVYHAIHGYRQHKGVMAATITLSFAGQCLFILVHYVASRSLGIEMNPWLFFILIPILSVATMLPSIGGFGVREFGIVMLFGRFIPSEQAGALSLLLDILILIFSFSAGLLFALRGGLRNPPQTIHEMQRLNDR